MSQDIEAIHVPITIHIPLQRCPSVVPDGTVKAVAPFGRGNAPYMLTFPALRSSDEPFFLRFGLLEVSQQGAVQSYVPRR